MGTYDSFTVDQLREIVDPDQPQTLRQQAEGWGKMAELLREYSLLLDERLRLVEDSWTGEAATMYFDEVRRVQEYIEDSAERATANCGLWCVIATMAGIAKHDVSHIHQLWKDLDAATDAVGLGFVAGVFGADQALEDFQRKPFDAASRQIMDVTMSAADESYARMRDFEEFEPPPSVDDSGLELQSVSTPAPPSGTAVAPPSTTVTATPAVPFGPAAPRPVVPSVIGSRPGMMPMARPMMGPGHTVPPVIGQRHGGSAQTGATGRLIGRDGVVRVTPDVDLRDPNASRAHYGGDDVNRGVIKSQNPQRVADEAQFKLDEEVRRLRERAYAHRVETLTADHSQYAIPGIVGDDSAWDTKAHDPGPVAFDVRRLRHRPVVDDWTLAVRRH